MNYGAMNTEVIFVAQTAINNDMIELFNKVSFIADEKYIKGKLDDVHIQMYAPQQIVLDQRVIVRLEQKISEDFVHSRIIVSTWDHKVENVPQIICVPILPDTVYEAIMCFVESTSLS